MSNKPDEITALDVIEALADGQRKLWEFTKQQMAAGRQNAACAIAQGIKQDETFSETAAVMGDDYGVENEDVCRLLDYAHGEREK